MPGIGHGDKLLTVESTFTSSVDAVSFRLFNTFALTLFDKPPFQLSHHAKNGHDDPAGFASRRHVWIEHSDECLPLIALMHNVEHIAGIAPQPVRRVTTSSSPGRRNSMIVINSARPSRLPPDTFSERITPQPSALSLTSCVLRSWSIVLTRA
jgi:hypothetical protein